VTGSAGGSGADVAALMPLPRTLGISFVTQRAERVTARMDWTEELCTAGGLLHGGALMALADSTGAACAFLNLPEGAGTTTVESATHFLRGVRGGTVEATSKILHAGRRVIVVDTEVRDDGDHLVARVTQTQLVLESRDGTAAR
jgi:1,4-dihydroxy-2-naphthoyl-CoA hydrolase